MSHKHKENETIKVIPSFAYERNDDGNAKQKTANTYDRAGVMTSRTRALIGAIFVESVSQSVSQFVKSPIRRQPSPVHTGILFTHMVRV